MHSIAELDSHTLTTLRLRGAMVRAARARAAALRERIDAIAQAELDAGEYVSEFDGTRITEPSKAWTMTDEQSDVYYARIAEAEIAAGFDAEQIREGYCPALVAENAVSDAENELVEAARAIPGCEHVTTNRLLSTYNEDGDGLTNRRRYVDLLVKLTA